MSETNMTYDTLIARRAQLQQEQQDLRQHINEWRERLATLEETRRQALKRYDVGHDSAQVDADNALGEIFAVESAIAKAERQLSEYPDRMHNLNLEIEKTSYRDRCKTLLALQKTERDAWREFEELLPAFYETWFQFAQARTERKSLARSLSNFAGSAGMTWIGDGGDFPAPTERDLQQWLQLKPAIAIEQIEGIIGKAGAVIGA